MEKILIIEDDPLVLRIYQKTFAFEGFTVELAHDGEEGIVKAKSFQPSLILLDMMMPKKNGMDTLGELKSNPETKEIPVVMLTNLVEDMNMNAALASGAMKYITKSDHEPEQVVEIVKKIFSDLQSK